MAFDFKKEYKEFYMPKNKPAIIEVPKMNYVAVRGKGNPNEENGDYQNTLGLLYGVAYTLKMSYKGDHKIDGFFEYVVPPLEGFWWQDGKDGIDYDHKEALNFISIIRLPDFVTKADFDWAVEEATKKKKQDFSRVEFLTYDEGLCVQCMHIGSYDDEPATVELMHKYMQDNGYELDITDKRYHHEIYLSDPRKCDTSKLKTVIRHPIKKSGWSEEACKNMMELIETVKKIEKEQAKMTPEEKKRNEWAAWDGDTMLFKY
ncbi:GyrI-like domain-containing protein [Candidatus Saccharibacteria bacterium]|nr:GyrI-like domain-containing protein [Candidatus Saccharibacteria bacterium]